MSKTLIREFVRRSLLLEADRDGDGFDDTTGQAVATSGGPPKKKVRARQQPAAAAAAVTPTQTVDKVADDLQKYMDATEVGAEEYRLKIKALLDSADVVQAADSKGDYLQQQSDFDLIKKVLAEAVTIDMQYLPADQPIIPLALAAVCTKVTGARDNYFKGTLPESRDMRIRNSKNRSSLYSILLEGDGDEDTSTEKPAPERAGTPEVEVTVGDPEYSLEDLNAMRDRLENELNDAVEAGNTDEAGRLRTKLQSVEDNIEYTENASARARSEAARTERAAAQAAAARADAKAAAAAKRAVPWETYRNDVMSWASENGEPAPKWARNKQAPSGWNAPTRADYGMDPDAIDLYWSSNYNADKIPTKTTFSTSYITGQAVDLGVPGEVTSWGELTPAEQERISRLTKDHLQNADRNLNIKYSREMSIADLFTHMGRSSQARNLAKELVGQLPPDTPGYDQLNHIANPSRFERAANWLRGTQASARAVGSAAQEVSQVADKTKIRGLLKTGGIAGGTLAIAAVLGAYVIDSIGGPRYENSPTLPTISEAIQEMKKSFGESLSLMISYLRGQAQSTTPWTVGQSMMGSTTGWARRADDVASQLSNVSREFLNNTLTTKDLSLLRTELEK